MGLDITTIVGVGAIGYGVYYAYSIDCRVKSDGTALTFMEWVNSALGYDKTVYGEASVMGDDGKFKCSAR